jgi:hypothetical protein
MLVADSIDLRSMLGEHSVSLLQLKDRVGSAGQRKLMADVHADEWWPRRRRTSTTAAPTTATTTVGAAPPTAPPAPAASDAQVVAQAVVAEAHVEEVVQLTVSAPGIVAEILSVSSSDNASSLNAAGTDALEEYAADVAEEYASALALEGSLNPANVEVTCMHLTGDPRRTNLLDHDETCSGGASLSASERTVTLLESAERSLSWLRWLDGASTDDLRVEVTLHPAALVEIGAKLVEQRANRSSTESNATGRGSPAVLTISDISDFARSTISEAALGALTVEENVLEPVGKPAFESRPLLAGNAIPPARSCPAECKCSSSGGPSGLAVNAEGYCVAKCSQAHNFGHVVKRFCGNGDHYMLGDYIDCTQCAEDSRTRTEDLSDSTRRKRRKRKKRL